MREALKEVGGFIRDIGFPIFVAVYFMVALSPRLDALSKSVDKAIVILETRK